MFSSTLIDVHEFTRFHPHHDTENELFALSQLQVLVSPCVSSDVEGNVFGMEVSKVVVDITTSCVQAFPSFIIMLATCVFFNSTWHNTPDKLLGDVAAIVVAQSGICFPCYIGYSTTGIAADLGCIQGLT